MLQLSLHESVCADASFEVRSFVIKPFYVLDIHIDSVSAQ